MSAGEKGLRCCLEIKLKQFLICHCEGFMKWYVKCMVHFGKKLHNCTMYAKHNHLFSYREILCKKHVSIQATPVDKGLAEKKIWGKTAKYIPSSSLFCRGTLQAIRFLAVRPSSATIFLTLSWLLERWKEAWKQEIQEWKISVYIIFRSHELISSNMH